MITPTPNSGPSKNPTGSEKGSSADLLRTQLAATGGRNQRRIANLKSESIAIESTGKVSKDEDVIILQNSIEVQNKMNSHLSWNDEKDRLTSLAEMSALMDDVSEEEKKHNKKMLYLFLKQPRAEFEDQCSVKRTKRTTSGTPASAEIFKLCTEYPIDNLVAVEYDADHVDLSLDDPEYSVAI